MNFFESFSTHQSMKKVGYASQMAGQSGMSLRYTNMILEIEDDGCGNAQR